MPSTLAAPSLSSLCATRLIALDAFADRAAVLDYCHDLARDNMSGYLATRGRTYDSRLWYEHSGTAVFQVIACAGKRVGFVSTWANRYSTPSQHIGDLQIEEDSRNLGIGSTVIDAVIDDARSSGCCEVTLNVFFDNPAAALYRRHGFEQIHFDGDKIRMRKFL